MQKNSLHRRLFSKASQAVQKPFPSVAEGLTELSRQLDRALTIAVVGEYSSGKSTFLNAMLERSVLPTGIKPTTSCVTYLRHGSSPSAVFHYSDGSSRSRDIQSLQTEGLHDASSNTDIDQIDVFVPSPLLEKSLILIDTPGLNAPNARDTERTQTILQHADVIIWLTSAQQIFANTELAVLKKYEKRFRRKSLCVISQVDLLNEPKSEVPLLLGRAESMLGDYFKVIVPISAWQALRGDIQQFEPLNKVLWGDLVPRSKDIVASGLVVDAEELLEKEIKKLDRERASIDSVRNDVLRFLETYNNLTAAHLANLKSRIEVLQRELDRIHDKLLSRIQSSLTTWSDAEPYTATEPGWFVDDKVVRYRTIQRWHWPESKAKKVNDTIWDKIDGEMKAFFKSVKSDHKQYKIDVVNACDELLVTTKETNEQAYRIIESATQSILIPKLDLIWSDFVVWLRGYTRAAIKAGNVAAVRAQIYFDMSTTKPKAKRINGLVKEFLPMGRMKSALSEDRRGYNNRMKRLGKSTEKKILGGIDTLMTNATTNVDALQQAKRILTSV